MRDLGVPAAELYKLVSPKVWMHYNKKEYRKQEFQQISKAILNLLKEAVLQ